jgi:hypothetical protein
VAKANSLNTALVLVEEHLRNDLGVLSEFKVYPLLDSEVEGVLGSDPEQDPVLS